jgi:ankyrin repeat protein
MEELKRMKEAEAKRMAKEAERKALALQREMDQLEKEEEERAALEQLAAEDHLRKRRVVSDNICRLAVHDKLAAIEAIMTKECVQLGEGVGFLPAEFGLSVAHTGTFGGNLSLLQWMKEVHGQDMNARAKDGTVPLHWAAKGGFLPIVRWLVEDCLVPPDVADKDLVQPMHLAAQEGWLDVMEYLASRGASVMGFQEEEELTLSRTGDLKIILRANSESFDLLCFPNEPIFIAKRRLQRQAGFALDTQEWTFAGSVLQEHKSLKQYNISNGSMVTLKITDPVVVAAYRAAEEERAAAERASAEKARNRSRRRSAEDIEAGPPPPPPERPEVPRRGCEDSAGAVPMNFAARGGHVRVLRWLVDRKASVSGILMRNERGPMHEAAQ